MVDLQNRTGTGYVFSSQHISDKEALEKFESWTSHRKPYNNIKPRLIKWKPNVLKKALGLIT